MAGGHPPAATDHEDLSPRGIDVLVTLARTA